MIIHAALHEAYSALKASTGNHEKKIEARLLLQHILNVNHAWLIAHEDETLADNHQTAFEALIKRRLNGEPIAYIMGYREFYGLKLNVTPDTLIPRADTETLVEAALARVPLNASYNVLDLGTGTGAIALAIAKHRPKALVTAVDSSDKTLQIAQKNAQHLDIFNVTFLLSNWFQSLHNKSFNLIVSNPPYIEENDIHLSQGDLRFEPTSALTAGADGLIDIRHIIKNAALYLRPNGYLLFEHGYNQAKPVANLLKLAEFKNIAHVKDLAGINRVTLGSI